MPTARLLDLMARHRLLVERVGLRVIRLRNNGELTQFKSADEQFRCVTFRVATASIAGGDIWQG